jgi:AraC-like DNA-binding protein
MWRMLTRWQYNARVYRWHAHTPSLGRYTHNVTRGFGHALLAPLVAYVFRELRISASVWDGKLWWAIHAEPVLGTFEIEHGLQEDRSAYNERLFSQVLKQRRAVRGEHGGYSDLFVPILVDRRVEAVLVVGRFALTRPTSADVLTRWRLHTGRHGHPSDAEFSAFLSATLSVLVLEGDKAAKLEKLLTCLARLMAGAGDAGKLTSEADALRVDLEQARRVEHTWEAVQSMVDARTEQAWSSAHWAFELGKVGLSRLADHVAVGLTSGRTPGLDPVEQAIRRDALQRAAVDLARKTGDAIAGRVGANGVVFLSASRGSAQRRKQKLLDLAEHASSLARERFDLNLHFGAAATSRSLPLSRSYQAALGAAESALIQGRSMVVVEPETGRRSHSLGALRAELVQTVEDRPSALPARFERYLQAVALRCGHQIDAARAHLEVGFEQMAKALIQSGALDEKSSSALRGALEHAAEEARSISDLFGAYHRAVSDVSSAMQRPVPARRDRALRRAIGYVDQHYTEPLRLEKVARLAGYAKNHFARLFLERERMSFVKYISRLRLERAKRLLIDTDLSVTRIAGLSGYTSVEYFCRSFRRALQMSPLHYRERAPELVVGRQGNST